MNIDQLRSILDKFINVSDLSDIEVLRIYEKEMTKEKSFFKEV